MARSKKRPNPEPPEELLQLKRSEPADSAAGSTGVAVAVQHVFSEMPVARGVKSLFSLNQHGGVDCPGCAWPDPDDERSRLGEYCENGAKAIAEEATNKRLTPAFFAEHSVRELAELNDFEIGKKGRIAQPMVLEKNATHYTPISWAGAATRRMKPCSILREGRATKQPFSINCLSGPSVPITCQIAATCATNRAGWHWASR
jgi:anaerobic selenocysteine-containing dehydrogenase